MTAAERETRILILAPVGRDASLLYEVLSQAGFSCVSCTDAADFRKRLRAGAGAVLLTEEALTPPTLALLLEAVSEQPSWSDLPLVVLVSRAWGSLEALGLGNPELGNNVTMLERPTRTATLVTVMRPMLRARARQYQVRDLMGQQGDINAQLEQRVEARTGALRASEARFAKMFRAGPVATSLTTREGGRFLDVNESFQTLTGYAHEEVVGRSDKELGMWSTPADHAKITGALREGGSYRDLELQLRTQNGEVRDILASAEVVEVDDAPCLLHMFYDVTERKQTEDELLHAVQEVMTDTAWFSRSLMEKLAQARAKRKGNAAEQAAKQTEVAELTQREKQVLERLATGQNNARIAAELGLAEQTVRNYISNIYEKLGIHSRADAIIWARERGLASF